MLQLRGGLDLRQKPLKICALSADVAVRLEPALRGDRAYCNAEHKQQDGLDSSNGSVVDRPLNHAHGFRNRADTVADAQSTKCVFKVFSHRSFADAAR